MTKAVYIIRKSKGSDDDIGLSLQREKVPELAEQVADETYGIDLGVHTGFSTVTRDLDQPRIDAHSEIQQLEEDLEAGEYDFVVAWDDRRIARDGYIDQLRRAAKIGGARFVFVDEDVEMDGMVHSVRREVEMHVKQEEIEKAIETIEKKKEDGDPLGPPPTGLTYTADKTDYEPGEDFAKAQEAIRLRDEGSSYPKIAEKTGIPQGTVYRIVDRREEYERFIDE